MAVETPGWIGSALANGRYLITAKLGEGGMGSVYRARDQNIDADVVIKVPLASMLNDPEFSRRFKDEIRSLVKLSHPHIVKVSDVGDWGGLPFAVMQFLPGRTLEDRRPLGPGGGFGAADPREVSKWLGGIAGALDYVHSQGFVHRDVKPGNILFDAQGHPFLGDFGVVKVMASSADSNAKSTRASRTGAGMVVGTAEYMAPELIMGESFDGRVDQYALAVTVFEMLCGRRPFEDEVTTKVLVLHTTKPSPPLNELGPWIPAPLSQAVLKGLAKDPNDRYANCVALASAVNAAIEGGFAGQPERVRFRCPACDKGHALSPSDYDKFRRSGRSLPCRACKVPFSIPRDDLAAAEPSPSGQDLPTVGSGSFATIGLSGEYAIAPEAPASPRTMVEQPGVGRPAGTMIEQPALKRAPGTMVEQPVLKRPAGTMVEQPGIKRPAATMVEQPGLGRRPDRANEELPTFIDLGAADRQAANEGTSSFPWIAVAGSVVASVVVLAVGLFLFMGRSGPRVEAPAPPAIEPIATALRPPATPEASKALPKPLLPPRPVVKAPEPKPADEPTSTDLASNETPATPSESQDSPAPDPDAGNAETPDPINAMKGDPRKDFGRPVAELAKAIIPSPGGLPPGPPMARPVGPGAASPPMPPLKPAKGNTPLDKVINTPQLFANQKVVLSQSYCIGNAVTRLDDGSFLLPVCEARLDLQYHRDQPRIVTQRSKSFVLELDPTLADRLIRRGAIRQTTVVPSPPPHWGNNVAIVTLGITPRAGSPSNELSSRIIGFEFLTDIGPRVVTLANKKKRRRIVYSTLTFTPDQGEVSGEGKVEDWAQPDRLQHIANQFKDLLENQTRQMSDARWNAFENMMGRMVNQAIRDNALPPVEMPKPRRVYP